MTPRNRSRVHCARTWMAPTVTVCYGEYNRCPTMRAVPTPRSVLKLAGGSPRRRWRRLQQFAEADLREATEAQRKIWRAGVRALIARTFRDLVAESGDPQTFRVALKIAMGPGYG